MTHLLESSILSATRQAVPETAYLYDAIHLYAGSLIKVLDEGGDPRNGKEIISSLYGLHYRSAMG